MSGVIPDVRRLEVPPEEGMEVSRDELGLHRKDEVGASEEVVTRTPLDSLASVPVQTPAQQTTLTEMVVLLLQDTENPPVFPAYNFVNLTIPKPARVSVEPDLQHRHIRQQ